MRKSLRRQRKDRNPKNGIPHHQKGSPCTGPVIQLNEGSEGTLVQKDKSVSISKDLVEAKILKADKSLIIGSNTRVHQKKIMSKLAKTTSKH